jgi:inorganic triphosphatase YgiF
MEIEVKLTVRPADLPAVRRAVGEVASIVQPAGVKHLESRYYDTPGRCLRAGGMALRVRRTDKGFIQTIKTERGQDTAFGRGEWEKPVASFLPEVDGGTQDLCELFVTDIARDKLIAAFPPWRADPSRIELAIDVGAIRSQGREEAVSEVELELLDGDIADVLDLGARLAEQVPLQLSVDSKSARGYRLADGAPPAAAKADKLEFAADISLGDGMRESLRACIHQWLSNQAAAFDGRDPEGVHQMRVALRRLRSAIAFFRDFIPDPPLAEFGERSKWVANSLGPARDWDVFLLEALMPLLREWPGHPGLRALQEGAEKARAEGYTEARVAMTSPAYTVFALRLAGWVERAGWRVGAAESQIEALARPMTHHAGHLLDRLYERVGKAGRDFDDLDAEAKHKLRIACKKLRYAGEFFRSLYGRKDVKKFRDALTDLLDLLGKLNDLTVARSLCGRLMEAGGADADALEAGTVVLLNWHEQRGHVSDKALSKAWEEFRDADPFWRD